MAQWIGTKPSVPSKTASYLRNPSVAAGNTVPATTVESRAHSILWYASGYSYTDLIDVGADEACARSLATGEIWTGPMEEEQAFLVTDGKIEVGRPHSQASGAWEAVVSLSVGAVIGSVSVASDLYFAVPYRGLQVQASEPCSGYLLPRRLLLRRAASWHLPSITVKQGPALWKRELSNHPLFILFQPLASRLAAMLLSLAEDYPGRPIWTKRTLAFSLSTQNLASLLHSDIEAIERLLREWRDEGWIGQLRGRLVLLDESALRAFCLPAYERSLEPS